VTVDHLTALDELHIGRHPAIHHPTTRTPVTAQPRLVR
jgi:hypothetical protein